jgi:hypothetical protein
VTHDTDFVSTLVDRVLCIGGRENRERYGIVQHPLASEGLSRSRVLHGDSFPANRCYGEDA